MIRILTFLFFTILLRASEANAQDSLQARYRFSVGYGAGYVDPILRRVHSASYLDQKQIIGPFFLKAELAIDQKTGFVASFNCVQMHAVDVSSYVLSHYANTSFTLYGYAFCFRINHYLGKAMTGHVEPYLGFGLGFRGYFNKSATDYQYYSASDNEFPLWGEATIGSRFYFTQRLAFYLEFGFAYASAQGGATIRF